MTEDFSLPYELADNSNFQIDDDLSLLNLMVNDMEASEAIYQPTKYWKEYTYKVTELIRKIGLHDFRRSNEEVLSSFGCLDTAPSLHFSTFLNNTNYLEEHTKELLGPTFKVANSLWESGVPVGPDGLTIKNFFLMSERLADAKAMEVGLKPLSELSISRYGNPLGYIKNETHHTFRSIYYFNFVCFIAQFVDISQYSTVVEIGSGSGAQAEILKKLFPELTVILLDLAPQLYIAERYLCKSLPNDLIPYQETNSKDWKGPLLPGKIYCLPLRAIEALAPEGKVLFWNAASFGEMEPNVLQNYAKHISSFSSHLFLMQMFSGKNGTNSPVTMSVYETAFSSYKLLGKSESTLADTVTPIFEDSGVYHNTFWEKKCNT